MDPFVLFVLPLLPAFYRFAVSSRAMAANIGSFVRRFGGRVHNLATRRQNGDKIVR